MQRAKQPLQQQERQRTYGRPFLPGQSGNPAGSAGRRERLERKVAELAEVLGGLDRMSALDRTYLEQAAQILMRRPRSHADAVRAANTVRGLIAAVERRRGRHEALSADFASLLPDGAP